MKRSNSLSEIPPLSPSLYPQSHLSQSLHTDFYNSANTTLPNTTQPSTMPYPSAQTLMEKLDQQNSVCNNKKKNKN